MKKIVSKIFSGIKKAWSIIVIFSILFGFYGYFHEKKPDIKFTIIGDANVFDIYKSVNDLEVYFLGKNIEKENLNLKIYNLRVENNGESDVLKNLYDDSLPWGFSIENGEIVSSPRLVKSNSQYLDLNLKPRVENGRVVFEQVIFDHKKYFILEFLVLHKKNENSKVVPFGKIAGVDKFSVLVDSEQEKKTILSQLLEGNIMIHAIRLITYTFFSIMILIISVFFIDKLDKIKIKERGREKRFQGYLNNEPILNPEISIFLKDLYIRNGLHGLKKIRKKLENEKVLISELERLKEKYEYTASEQYLAASQRNPLINYYDRDLLDRLVKNENNIKIIEPSLKTELNKLICGLSKVKSQ